MQEFARRRERLLEKLDRGVAIFASAPEKIRSNDVHYNYRQDSNLLYLTGFQEPEAWVILDPRNREAPFTMVVRPRDPERETWEGRRAGAEGAQRDYGANRALTTEKLQETLMEALAGAERLYYSLGRYESNDALIFDAIKKLRPRARDGVYTPHTVVNVQEIMEEMRLVKSEADLGPMRKATQISAEAHVEAMRATRPGRREYEVQAVLEFVFKMRGSHHPGYPSIVGSGANATILHYRENDRQMRDGELLLVDAGAEIQGYSADITRTWPVNGRFSPEQRAVYDLVLAAQEVAIGAVRPGAAFNEIHDAAVAVIARGLADLGIVEGPVDRVISEETYKKFFMHKTSHWLGLDVHDVGKYRWGDTWRTLAPGMILTVEPGIYIPAGQEGVDPKYHGIGIRIEDDLLVTDQGSLVLTRDVPKSPSEIESVMKSPPRIFSLLE